MACWELRLTRRFPSFAFVSIIIITVALGGLWASPGFAQEPSSPPSPPEAEPSIAQAPAAEAHDDAVLRPLEPDFTLVNLPTTLPLPLHKGNFRLTHRFNGNPRLGDVGD